MKGSGIEGISNGPRGGGRKLSEHAYFVVRNAILSGDLGFGEHVTRRDLAKQLGMSLPPVSEALQRLEHEGLVESKPRVGTRVRSPSELDMRGHLVVREALETQAASLFARQATAEQQRELQACAARVDQAFREPEPNREEYSRMHEGFHLYIAECSGYRALVETIQTQVAIWTWLGSRLAWAPTVKLLSDEDHLPWHWHEELARALCSGDAVIAERTMRRHVRRGMQVLVEQLQKSPANAANGMSFRKARDISPEGT